MPLLVQRVGKERLYAEAVDSHIGGWFWNAAARARVNPIAQPEYDYDLPTSDSEDWSFSATVEVQPKPEPADWTTLEVPKVEAEVPEEAVQAELETLQRIAAEIVPVEGRPAQEGDTVVIDLAAEDGTAQRDYVVELGSERLVEEVENGIRGLSAGESREIAYELADGTTRKATVTAEGAEGARPAAARRRPRQGVVRVRHARRAARRHRRAPARADRRRDRGPLPRRGDRRARARLELHRRRPARRGAHARAAERPRPQPAGARHRREHLPAAHRPDARGARAAPARRGVAVGLARARARGGRRPARHRGHATTRSARSCAPRARATRTSRRSSPRAARTAFATTSA